MGAIRGSLACVAPTAGRSMSSQPRCERYRSVRPDGRDGEVLVIERQPGMPPPHRHPLTGDPLRRLWDCVPPDERADPMSSHPDLPQFLHADHAIDALRWGLDGLLPVICQSHSTGEVLMFAHANRAALLKTRSTGLATYWSRSRQALWTKGETSGNLQRIVEIRPDCDGDCLLYLVEADGPACHTGRRSCFSWRMGPDGSIACDRPILDQRLSL